MEETAELIIRCDDYIDFTDEVAKIKDNNVKGLIQEIFAKIYFNVHKKHYDIKKYYAHPVDDIPEDLGVATDDKGTDGIILHNNNEISLVQVKFRSNTYVRLKRDCLGGMSLEAFANKNRVRNLYIFSNTVLPPRNLTAREKSMLRYIMADVLTTCNWDLIKTYSLSIINSQGLNHKIPNPKPPTLLDWQKRAVNFIFDIDNDVDVANYEFGYKQIVSACGSGKSLLASSIVFYKHENNYVYNNSLVIVPNLQLLSQWFDMAATLYPNRSYCLVGSDMEQKNTNTPYSISTNVNEIRDSMTTGLDNLVCISTYQSIDRVIKAAKEIDLIFDIAICDEAHLCCQVSTKETCFSKPANPSIDVFPVRNKLFMTATPKVFTGGAKESINDMDNTEIFGERFEYSFRNAIDDDVISDYKIIVGVSDKRQDLLTDDLRIQFYAEFLVNSVQKGNILSLLVCSSNHAESKKLYDEVVKLNDELEDPMIHELLLMPKAANSETKSTAVRKILSNEPIIVFNVKIFSIGTNVPNLEAVMITKDKKSVIDSVQTVSRCMRKYPDKEHGTILIPCILNSQKLDGSGDYPNLRNFLSAMSSVDKSIKEEILLINRSIRNNSKTKRSISKRRILVEYVDGIDFHETENNPISTGYKLAIMDSIGNASAFSSDIKFELLKEYMELNGEIPGNKIQYKGFKIGEYLSRLTKQIRKLGWNCKEKIQVEELMQIEDIRDKLKEKIDARTKLSDTAASALKDYILTYDALPESGVVHEYNGNTCSVGLVLSLLIGKAFYDNSGEICLNEIMEEFDHLRDQISYLVEKGSR